MECDGQRSCEEAKGRGCGVEEGFWNPGGRRRGSRGELQGPCNHCFAEGAPAENPVRIRVLNPQPFHLIQCSSLFPMSYALESELQRNDHRSSRPPQERHLTACALLVFL